MKKGEEERRLRSAVSNEERKKGNYFL